MKSYGRTSLLVTCILAVPFLASAIVSRGRESTSLRTTIQSGDSPAVDSENLRNISSDIPPPVSVTITTPHFDVFRIQGRKSIAELESRLGADAFAALLKINRIDRKHIRVGDSLVIPAANADVMSLAPFPIQLEAARKIPKLILVSRRVQAFAAYESGRLVRWGPTSTGKKSTPTPAGLYHTNWKAIRKVSSINESWILPWCFNLDDVAGFAFHQFDLPGYPASHGCVRLLEEDAKWIYGWADQWTRSKSDDSILAFGTPVIIFGEYKYGENPAWKRLADDSRATAISIAETETAMNQHLPVKRD